MNYQKGGFNQQNWWYDGFSTIKWPNNRGLSNYDGDYTLSNEQAKMGLTINHLLCVFSSGLTFFFQEVVFYTSYDHLWPSSGGMPYGFPKCQIKNAGFYHLNLMIWPYWVFWRISHKNGSHNFQVYIWHCKLWFLTWLFKEVAYNIVSVSELSQVCLGLSEVIVHCNLGEMVVSSKCSWDVLPAGYCPCCAGDFPQHCHGMCDS